MTTDVNDAINHPVSLAADVGAHVERSGSLPVKQSTSCGSEFFNAPPRASSDKWLAKPDHGLGTSPTLQPPTMESQNITDDKATRPGPLRRRSETQPTNVSFLSSPDADIHRNKSPSSLESRGSGSVVTSVPINLRSPNYSTLRLKWTHVPFNNPSWVHVSTQMFRRQ